MDFVHKPVLLEEVIDSLKPTAPHMLLIDGTLGEGGHAEAFLNRFHDLSYCGVDADPSIQAKARNRLAVFGDRMQFANQWFDDFFAQYSLSERPDRILLDLGISIFHYQESGRGFSFSKSEPLDMRLGDGISLSDYLVSVTEEDLAGVIFKYGEDRYGKRIARAIVNARQAGELDSKSLADVIFNAVPADYRHGRIHPATRTFQALRIVINQELERLSRVLLDAFKVLKVGGIMGIISFHSLEDRIVKTQFKEFSKDCHCPPELPRCVCERKPYARLLTKKPIEATEAECDENPPSRSAKLRVLVKEREIA